MSHSLFSSLIDQFMQRECITAVLSQIQSDIQACAKYYPKCNQFAIGLSHVEDPTGFLQAPISTFRRRTSSLLPRHFSSLESKRLTRSQYVLKSLLLCPFSASQKISTFGDSPIFSPHGNSSSPKGTFSFNRLVFLLKITQWTHHAL